MPADPADPLSLYRRKIMRNMLAAAICAFLTTQAQAVEPSPADKHQLFWLAQRMDHAWTAGDAEANTQLFAADATARFGDDPLGDGRDAIRDQFRGFFKDRPSGLRHLTNIERIELLSTKLAMWDAEVRVERRQADGKWAALTRIRNVTLISRQPDGWRIQAVRAFPLR